MPDEKLCEHAPEEIPAAKEQSIPSGDDVIRPLPLPAPSTTSE
jgi:hypothetical protein